MRIRNLLSVACLSAISASTSAILKLDDDNFDGFVDSLQDDALLLVDFFRPGCSSCQRVSPVLDYLEKTWEEEEPDPSKRWFKIAKVDCSKNPRLASVFGIERFPDLKFLRAGQWGTYEGNWTIEGFQEFKDRMAVVPLPVVGAEELGELAATAGAVFVLVSEDGMDPNTAAKGVALAATGLQHRAVFTTASSEAFSTLGLSCKSLPMLAKVMSGPSGLLSLPFDGNTETAFLTKVTQWIESENHPLVSELSSDNFSRIGGLGKLMVIGLVDPRAKETEEFTQAFNRVAAGMGLKHSDKLVFGIMDGVRLSGFAETVNIYDGFPRMIVFDMPRSRFYTKAITPLGTVEMEAILFGVLSGDIPRQELASENARLFAKIWRMIKNGGWWSSLLVIPLVGILWVFCDSPDREEARAKARQEKRDASEARRAKID